MEYTEAPLGAIGTFTLDSIFYITAPSKRPDFRLLQRFVWDGDVPASVDTDGNSYPADSTVWTELTIITRDARQERFDVDPVQDDPLILKIKSKHRHLAARAAYALAIYTDGKVAESISGPFHAPGVLIPAMGDTFDLSAALLHNTWLHPPRD